jgi:hypothetical protein
MSISERGDRVAALVSIEGNCERQCEIWLVIKNVKTDNIVKIIDLIDPELSSKIGWTCPDTWSTCNQKPEVKRRIQAANAVLANDRWRPFPCYFGVWAPERVEAGCEPAFSQFDIDFENARLRIAHQGRVLVNARKPAWPYRDPLRSPGGALVRRALCGASHGFATGIGGSGSQICLAVGANDSSGIAWNSYSVSTSSACN